MGSCFYERDFLRPATTRFVDKGVYTFFFEAFNPAAHSAFGDSEDAGYLSHSHVSA